MTKQTASLNLNKPDLSDLIGTTITQLASNFDVIDSHLAEKVTVYDVKKYGAKGDGITDDTQAIKNAIADMTDNSILFFRTGIYKFTSDIIINNLLNITIKGDGASATRLINASTNKTISITNCSYVDINDIGIVGNGIPPSGTGATGGDGLSFTNTSHVMFNGVDIGFHGGNGINLIASCWVFHSNNVRIIGNQKNGFEGLSLTSLQATAIYFNNTVIWYNKFSGIHWCGIGLSINNCVIEQNQRGIWLDCTNSVSNAANVTVLGSDFEQNVYEQIKITPYNNTYSGLAILINGNNFVNVQANQANSTALIVVDNIYPNVIGLELGINNYGGTTYFNVIEANDKLYADCKIAMSSLIPSSKFSNLGLAKITGISNVRVINGLIEQKGIPFTTPEISDELISGLNPNGYWRLPINEWGFINSLSMSVTTDSTAQYSVLFILNTQNPDGTYTSFASGEITKIGSGTVTYNLGMGLPNANHSILMLQTYVTKPTTGTTFKIKNVAVDGSF